MKVEVYRYQATPDAFGPLLLSTEMPQVALDSILVIEGVKYKSVTYPQFVFVDGQLSVVQLAVKAL